MCRRLSPLYLLTALILAVTKPAGALTPDASTPLAPASVPPPAKVRDESATPFGPRTLATPRSTITVVDTKDIKKDSAAGLPWWLTVLLLPFAAWFGAKAWEIFSAGLTRQRVFIQETTKRVVTLSETHYWTLANAAGTLAGRLDGHLRQAELLLFTPWRLAEDPVPDPEAAMRLQTAFHNLAESTSNESFPALVRLLWAFERFQLRGSNTYIVPDHAAGEGLRRLYNRFAASLPQEPFVTNLRRGVEQHLAEEVKPATGEPPGIHGRFLEDGRRLKALGIAQCRDQWCAWLRDSPVSVEEATAALHAFAMLLAHEMALLNRVFFRDSTMPHETPSPLGRVMAVARMLGLAGAAPYGGASALAVQAIAADRWPGLLDGGTALTLRRVEEESVFFAPLGRTVPVPTSPSAKEEQRPSDGKARAGGVGSWARQTTPPLGGNPGSAGANAT